MVREGRDVSIIAYGAQVREAAAAAERLSGDGVEAEVLDLRSLKPLDEEAILATTRTTGKVLIVPWGEVESVNGRFTVDEESGRLAVEAFEAHGCDLPIDYEHQTLGGQYTSPNGQAPAAGWIQKLEVVVGKGITAEVKWTEPAMQQPRGRGRQGQCSGRHAGPALRPQYP